jgi:hypothetical protein
LREAAQGEAPLRRRSCRQINAQQVARNQPVVKAVERGKVQPQRLPPARMRQYRPRRNLLPGRTPRRPRELGRRHRQVVGGGHTAGKVMGRRRGTAQLPVKPARPAFFRRRQYKSALFYRVIPRALRRQVAPRHARRLCMRRAMSSPCIRRQMQGASQRY